MKGNNVFEKKNISGRNTYFWTKVEKNQRIFGQILTPIQIVKEKLDTYPTYSTGPY